MIFLLILAFNAIAGSPPVSQSSVTNRSYAGYQRDLKSMELGNKVILVEDIWI